MKIIVIAEIPDKFAKDFMQHVRTFDKAKAGCKFSMIANAPNMTTEQVARVLEVQPPLKIKIENPGDITKIK